MTKAYSYIRFSSKRQASGDSFRRQTQLANEYAQANGLTLSDENYLDLGVSAWRGSNKNDDAGLGRFLSACYEGKVKRGSYLLVESLDRLSRERVNFAMNQLTGIINSGIIVVTLIDGRSFKDGDPNLVTDLIISLIAMQRAHEESETKSKRIKATWANKRANPFDTDRTAKCPFWLKLNKDKRTYKVLDEHKAIVERIFQLAIDGFGMLRIAKALNADGIKTPTGKEWQEGSISAILNGKQVLGVYQPHMREGNKRVGLREEIENYYPAIIESRVYRLAQSRLAERKKGKGGGRQGSNENVFLGTATCAKCGSSMVLTKKEVSWLTCKQRIVKECDNAPVRLDVMQQWLKEAFLQPVFSSAFLSVDKVDYNEEIEVLAQERDDEQEALQGLLAATKDFSNVAVTQEITRRSTLITELSERIVELESKSVTHDEISGSLAQTEELVKSAISKEVSEEVLKDRLQLKRILNNRLNKLKILHENKVIELEVGVNDGADIEYQSLERPTTALKRINEGVLGSELWSVSKVNSTFIDKYKEPATIEDSAPQIEA